MKLWIRASTLAIAFCAIAASGCKTQLFRSEAPDLPREKALARCINEVAPEAVPYADAFASCMEGYGWSYEPG